MTQTPDQQHYPDDEIDLRELFATIWRGKWIIILTTLIFAVSGVGYALYKPNIYQSSVLLAPVQEEGGGLSGMASQFGGLASLAGINLGGGGSQKIVIAKEILQSHAFLSDFFHRHNFAVQLMAVEGWKEKSGEWIYDRDKYNPDTGEWLLDDKGKSYKPSDWELVKLFKERHFSVSEARDTGMVTVTVKHFSPVAAQHWANLLIQDINEHIRGQDVRESEARIAYLEEKLNETNVSGMQQVFYQLIENETRTVMLANARHEYVFKVVDPAVVPEEKSEPKRAVIAVIATLLGAFLGVFLVLVLAFCRSEREDKV